MTMAITTNQNLSSSSLRDLIYDGIQKKHIQTWAIYDEGGVRYLTHAPEQWRNKGYLQLDAVLGALKVAFVAAEGVPPTDELKGVYQGRFAEMLYAHDQPTFKSGVATIAISVD